MGDLRQHHPCMVICGNCGVWCTWFGVWWFACTSSYTTLVCSSVATCPTPALTHLSFSLKRGCCSNFAFLPKDVSSFHSWVFVQLYRDRTRSAGEPKLGLLHVEGLHPSRYTTRPPAHLLTQTDSSTWRFQKANNLNDLRPCNVNGPWPCIQA